MKETKGNRTHIGFFGKRNAGKSTIVNNIIGQELSIVSDTKGTTTDTNEKSMELLPIGPVTLIDTAGIDDIGELGNLRINSAMKAYKRCDVVVFVADYEPLSDIEKTFIINTKKDKKPIISIINKTDENEISNNDYTFLKENTSFVFKRKNNFINNFKEAILEVLPKENMENKKILSDIVGKNEICILVIPIDKEAPKGRLILPQVNVIRELLDNNSICMICKDTELELTLSLLKNKPNLVVVDSQCFKKVSEILPNDVMLTSFSILFARLKGDFKSFVSGAKALDNIKDNDKILILESCSHHPVEDDIGRVKIPNLIKKYTNKKIIFDHYSGHDFPKNIKDYKLIVHCGGCMTTRSEILNRIKCAKENNVPISNYGIIIAKCINILNRAIKPIVDSF